MAGEGGYGSEGLCTGQTLPGHHPNTQQVSATINIILCICAQNSTCS